MALFVAMAGVGAGVGMGIDASKKTEVVLHQAPRFSCPAVCCRVENPRSHHRHHRPLSRVFFCLVLGTSKQSSLWQHRRPGLRRSGAGSSATVPNWSNGRQLIQVAARDVARSTRPSVLWPLFKSCNTFASSGKTVRSYRQRFSIRSFHSGCES